ncbi:MULTISPECIES: LysR family transcriptional regulator [unclassified Cupriavidus]|uniref:LysR family transcriptional regulator n=1 Tax=unclassified Cupriavidus TaxID=2640874 RepID=UPI000415A1C9|nr:MULTISPECIES: LysR family transcriptional regulator [unclassified Cupriavidus]MBP0630392.1 LysR family transcriptional regulator [Cupriavidus sp. AcVe19-1a]
MNMPRTTLEQWRVVQAIVEHGGYAQAAEVLHRSQSSVSYMVARLQEQLGVELFSIEGRKAKLTENGAALLARANELLDGACRLEQLADNLQQGWEAEVRLAVDAALPPTLLLSALKEFAGFAPQTRVHLTEVVLSGADQALLERQVDLAVGTRVPTGHFGERLVDIPFIAVAHRDHRLHRLGRELTAEDLSHEMQVVLRDSGHANPRDDGWLGATLRWTVSNMESMRMLVAGGLGFAWLPAHLVTGPLEQGAVQPLPLREGRIRHVVLYLVHSQPVVTGPATRRLADLLAKAAQAFAKAL